MAKFTYRGKTLEELQKMSLKEFAQLVPSRQRRSLLRMSEAKQAFVEQVSSTNNPNRTHFRDVVITPLMVGKKVAVYNGKEFSYIDISPEMIGHFLGEYAPTRKPVKHSAAGIGATRSTKFIAVK
ncbi:MAG: 30S ribosomal protein S19 [Candidatus Diapherotrites archaeon]|nr:30S ribosomal protein S19 [Candidatus Diapherotrites archaeon]